MPDSSLFRAGNHQDRIESESGSREPSAWKGETISSPKKLQLMNHTVMDHIWQLTDITIPVRFRTPDNSP
jgi:hypothetical protein